MIKIGNNTIGTVYKVNAQYNLIKGSNTLSSGTSYRFDTFEWDDRPSVGTQCTITVCACVGTKDGSIGIYQNGGYSPIASFGSKTETISSFNFTVHNNSSASSTNVDFYHSPNDGDYDPNSYVKWAVVTLGYNNPVTKWIPAKSETTDKIAKMYKGSDLVYPSPYFIATTSGSQIVWRTNSDDYVINCTPNVPIKVYPKVQNLKFTFTPVVKDKNINKSITSLDFEHCMSVINSLDNVADLFYGLSGLQYLNMPNWTRTDTAYAQVARLFSGCDNLNHIRCNQAFKDWCLSTSGISLPDAMKQGGTGTWEIVN